MQIASIRNEIRAINIDAAVIKRNNKSMTNFTHIYLIS